MRLLIYIQGIEVDQYEDESVILKSAIADIENITDLKTDFTRSFTVPASKNNNKLFKHYYNADIDNTFDARKLVKGELLLSNRPFKIGKFALHKVSVKNGNPSSYTINFTGNLIDLKDKIGKDKLTSLDFSEYNHPYNGNSVLNGLVNSIFAGDIKYSLLAQKQYYYNTDTDDNTQTEELSNIAENASTEVHGVKYTDLKPSIRLGVVMDKIQSTYGIVFSDDFISLDRFRNLYMHCSNEEGLKDVKNQVVFNSGSDEYVDLSTGIGTYILNRGLPDSSVRYVWKRFDFIITPKVGFENVDYTLYFEVDGEDLLVEDGIGNGFFTQQIEDDLDVVYTTKVFISSSSSFECDVEYKQVYQISTGGSYDVSTFKLDFSISSDFNVSLNLPDIEIMEFLKSLFTAFKLIIVPQEDGSLYINTLDEYYSQGNVYGLDKYTDVYNYDVEAGKLLNKITYKFADTDTILNNQFKNKYGKGYGDQLVDNGELLLGDELEIETVFENVLYERLTDVTTGDLTSIGYGALIDENRNKVTPKLLLHYVVKQSNKGGEIRLILDNNSLQSFTRFNVPSNTVNLDVTNNQNTPFSFMFSSEFSYYDSSLLTNNIYDNYHKRSIEGIFNIKRRDVYFKSLLPDFFISKIKLNDVLKIKGVYYRIDNFESNLITGETKFKLFNAYDTEFLGKPTAEHYITESFNFYYPYEVDSINVTGDGDLSWITVSNSEDIITITLSDNETGSTRTGRVIITTNTGFVTTVYITQSPNAITIDNNIITADSNIITADNN